MSWSKSFVIIGSTLLVLSMMSGMLVDHVINVRDGEFHGYWMECIESPVMQLESDNILSLYVLEIADGIRFVEDGTLENVTPVFKLENITRYSGVIELPSQGQYLVVVTTKYT
jgi:hypothetical protein